MMNYIDFLSVKFFLKARGGFISFMSFVAILGIVVGVSVLIVVMAVMNGFDNELQNKIMQNNPHILITSNKPIRNDANWLNSLKVPLVKYVVPMVYGQIFLRVNSKILPVLVRGIENKYFTCAGPHSLKGQYPQKGELLVGQQLAKQFGVNIGDVIYLVSPLTGQSFPFRISGIFSTGMYDYDMNLAYTNISDLQQLLFLHDKVNAVALYLNKPFEAEKVKQQLYSVLSARKCSALTWIESNRTLFSALKLEKYVMFLILLLIIIVASFNIVSSLIVLVATRTKEIAILKSLGLLDKEIYLIFLKIGGIIGAIGSLLGCILGVGISFVIQYCHIIKLPPDIYYISYLPANLNWKDVLTVTASAFIISLLSGFYPAAQAANVIPNIALRYE